MASSVGNVFAQLFFGSMLQLAVSVVFLALGVYLAARLLSVPNNNLGRAFSVSIAALVVSFVPRFFFFLDPFFVLLVLFAVLLAAIRTIYNCDWSQALLVLLIGGTISTLLAIALNPLFVDVALDWNTFS